MMADCSTCRFMAPLPQGGGNCRRYPPTIVSVPHTPRMADDTGMGGSIEQYFPFIADTDWCGEHRTRPPE